MEHKAKIKVLASGFALCYMVLWTGIVWAVLRLGQVVFNHVFTR